MIDKLQGKKWISLYFNISIGIFDIVHSSLPSFGNLMDSSLFVVVIELVYFKGRHWHHHIIFFIFFNLLTLLGCLNIDFLMGSVVCCHFENNSDQTEHQQTNSYYQNYHQNPQSFIIILTVGWSWIRRCYHVKTSTNISLIASVAIIHITTNTRTIGSTDSASTGTLTGVTATELIAIWASRTHIDCATMSTIGDSTTDAGRSEHSLIYCTGTAAVVESIAVETGWAHIDETTDWTVLYSAGE